MNQWTSSSYTKRLQYELRDTTPKGRARLQATMSDIERHLQATGYDTEEVESWCELLQSLTSAMKQMSSGTSTSGETGSPST